MRTSIALSGAALLLAAAGARTSPRFPGSRAPAAPVIDTTPTEAPIPGAFLETFVGVFLPSKPAEPALIEELLRLHDGPGPQAQDEELALLGDLEALKGELRRAFNLARYRRAGRICDAILESHPQDAFARDLQDRLREARRDRVLYFTQTRPAPRLDAETLDDLTPGEWREIASGILDERRVDLNVQRASLEWVLLELRLSSGIPLILEAPTGDRVRVDPLVTLGLSDVPLRQALRFVFDQAGPWLEMEIGDEKVVLIRDGWDPDRY